MALFGKKANDASSAPSADDITGASGSPSGGLSGGPNTLTADSADEAAFGAPANGSTNGKRAKAVREPKASRGKTIKNGVAVGLNIGNQSIKAVEVSSKGGELSVTAMGSVPTPPESYSNGNVLSVSALSGAIRELWRTAGIKSKVAITSVAGTGALVVRVIEVPKMSDGELKANMQVDADRYIPFPPSEVVMDFKALRELPTDPDAPNMEVLLAAAQREVIDLHVNVVQKARLSPRAIDVEPIAAVRALQLERQGNHTFADYNEVTAVVNIGATGAEISILRGDILVFTRAVPNGGNSVTQAISSGMGIAFSDAENLKISSADALPPAGYNANDDFGFGTAGDDFDFGTPSAVAPLTDDDFGAPPAAASDDPFDLDFFDQNPKQDEPGAGHAQKEDDTLPSSSPFDFDFATPAATPPSTPATPPAASTPDEESAGSAFDFSFSAPDTPAAPVAASAPATPPAPASPFGFDFDDPQPGTTASASASASTSDKGTRPLNVPASEDSLADDFPAPAASAASADQDEAALTPSAFDFDNFNLPTVQPGTSSGASSASPLAQTEPSAFAMDVPASEPSASPTPAGASTADQFDLDSIFGTPAATVAATTPVVTTPVASQSAPALGALDATISPSKASDQEVPAAAVDDSFDLGGSGTGLGDPTAGFGAPADDFAAFGAASAPSASSEAVTLYNLIYGPLEELSNEVRRSLEFHLGRYPDATISRIVLMGGGAKLRNMDVFLTQMIGLPTVVANPFAHVAVRSAKLTPSYATENGPICAVALGLALRDFID